MGTNEEFDQLKEEIRSDLENNPIYQSFWDKYEDHNNRSFIDHYSRVKTSYLLYGKIYHERDTEEENKLLELGNEYLNIIQQKKLYDLQCLWRSEKIELPEIEISKSFLLFEANINHCKFIEPIKPNEVEILCDFILEYAVFSASPDYIKWQEYPFDKEDQENFSKWYEYFEMRTEIKGYQHLEDKRGKKEEKYRNIFLNEQRKKNPPQPTQPYNYVSVDKMEELFMKQYETPLLREQKKAFERNNYSWYKEDLSWAIEILMKSETDIPVKENPSWFEATRDAATSVWRLWLAEAVRNAYEIKENKLVLGIDIAGEWDSTNDLRVKFIKEQIIEGRKIAGEPEDLNF